MGNFSCSVARATQGGDSYHRGLGKTGPSPRLAPRGASGLWVSPHGCLLLGRRWQEAGWAGASTSPDPTPSPPLKTEAQGGGLDGAEVSQLARGHLGLQCPSPDSRIVSVSARARTPEASPPSERPSVWHLLACPPSPPPCCQRSDSLGGPVGNPPRLHLGSASPSSWVRSGCTSRGAPPPNRCL